MAVKGKTCRNPIFFPLRNIVSSIDDFGSKRESHRYLTCGVALYDDSHVPQLGRKSINLPSSQCKLMTNWLLLLYLNRTIFNLQLVSRGRIHVFKYLEIQAIKEDRKRGVLQDNGDYRRSYRKTAQLNDFRFASGFGADARRKRHTADSGYGSEQPLDRRWSQEFNQEVKMSWQFFLCSYTCSFFFFPLFLSIRVSNWCFYLGKT